MVLGVVKKRIIWVKNSIKVGEFHATVVKVDEKRSFFMEFVVWG